MTFPGITDLARGAREFPTRAVRFAEAEAGVRQFLNIGVGPPAVGNIHEAAQRVDPQARVVHVDNDELVLSHARALLTVVRLHGGARLSTAWPLQRFLRDAFCTDPPAGPAEIQLHRLAEAAAATAGVSGPSGSPT